MKLSFFTMPIHPVGRNWTETLNEDREAVMLADRLGYAEAFIGEHVTDAAETITSSLMFLSSLAFTTKSIKLGTGTVNMPNNHPAQVAAQVAMIDHMLEGRFIFGISPGGLRSDAEAFGNLDADRNAMFLEAIDQVLAIWSGKPPYNIKGKFWTISTERTLIAEIGQGIMAKPFQRPHPPIVVTAVAPFSKGITAAAARGWTPISANFLQPIWVASHWPKYAEGCRLAGRPADPADWRVAKSIFVADDEVTAREYARGAAGPYAFYYRNLMRKLLASRGGEIFKADPKMPDDKLTLDYVLDTMVIAGTPSSVVEQILALRATTGDFGTLVYAGHDWMDKRLARRSMELMATDVMPAVNRALGTRSAAQ
ncbi:MAG: LLM class flavin-dependent oxidoreductase [Rhodospirillales bacterium]|nr:LLM class flavin-dependent oxidoreductase [Rhodospirillales bacterium]